MAHPCPISPGIRIAKVFTVIFAGPSNVIAAQIVEHILQGLDIAEFGVDIK